MNYVIKNYKGVYIRLNQDGAPVTCAENDKAIFEYSKAKNILDNLPKTLKRLNFQVFPESVLFPTKYKNTENKVIESENYVVSDTIKQWVEKFGICDDILKEAQVRKEELNKELSDIDKAFSNIVHKIELEDKIDMYSAWKEIIEVQKNRKKRREIKDEILIISSVIKMDFRNLDRNIIDKMVVGLAKRKFSYRIVEDNEEEITNNAM